MSMTIIPAIDLLDGSCVRLLHGDFAQCKVYDLDAQRLAADYAERPADEGGGGKGRAHEKRRALVTK